MVLTAAFGRLRVNLPLERRLLSVGFMQARHELRRSKRVATYIDVRWCRKTGDVAGKGTDINADGMFLQTDVEVEPGTLMELRLQLPDRELAVFATAVFVGRTAAGRGIGLEFYMMSSHTRLSWLTYYHILLDVENEALAERIEPSSQPGST
jgi:hypothetical protein